MNLEGKVAIVTGGGKGVGRAMWSELEQWFRSKSVDSLELQVLCGNEPAVAALRAIGFQAELLQMRKRLD